MDWWSEAIETDVTADNHALAGVSQAMQADRRTHNSSLSVDYRVDTKNYTLSYVVSM